MTELPDPGAVIDRIPEHPQGARLLAVLADRQIRGAGLYRTLLIWPYAIAPAVAAVLWIFLFHPQIGALPGPFPPPADGDAVTVVGASGVLEVLPASGYRTPAEAKAGLEGVTMRAAA